MRIEQEIFSKAGLRIATVRVYYGNTFQLRVMTWKSAEKRNLSAKYSRKFNFEGFQASTVRVAVTNAERYCLEHLLTRG